MIYAGFWRRLGALLIDTLVFLPLAVLNFALFRSRTWRLVWPVTGALVAAAYNIWLHATRGQTLGKMATRIQVLTVDGEQIGWTHAIRRYAVDLALALVSATTRVLAVSKVSDTDFAELSWLDLGRRIDAASSPMLQWEPLLLAWAFGEVVTMLFNRRRRALHDIIGGTVVVQIRRSTISAIHAEPSTD